ncbi:MAG: hypothetical protein NC818_05205 [Candidatus Omnitrophica bacterium]|nr:hypothetical protein [Candidatus Omnitrophota bacterium]
MKKFIIFSIFLLIINLNLLFAEGEVSSLLIAREKDYQVERLRKWLGNNFPEIEIKLLDFDAKEAKEILSFLKLDFIPAVVFENPSLSEETIKKFRIITEENYAYIPREVLRRIVSLELYKRELIPNRLEIFSMSFCPYSNRAEKRLINYLKISKLNNIDFKIHYLVNLKEGKLDALHGLRELNENRRRVVIQKYWPNKLFDYLLLRDKYSYRQAIRTLGIGYAELKEKLVEADKLLLQDYQYAKELNIHASPTFLWQNKFLISSLEQLTMFSPFDKEHKIEEPNAVVEKNIKILMFFSPKCHACHKVKEEFLPEIITKYKNLVEIVYYNIEEPQNFSYLMELEEKYGILESGSIPKIFVGNNVLVGAGQIRESLEKIILKVSGEKMVSVTKEKTDEKIPERIINLFKTFTFGTIIWAGLIDGINPCAFTTLVFFLSFLSFAGYRKREVFYLGTFFILSIFLTYFFLGLGIFKFITQLKIYHTLVEIFYMLVGILVIILALINFLEFFRYRKTKNLEDIKLKLPHAIKWRIQSIIGRGYRKEKGTEEKPIGILRLVLLSLVIGFIVSILESVCTGQVYLPTITFITKVSEFRVRAMLYLFIYNLMFILPLVVIFVLVLYGLTSERFAKFAQRHLAKIKLLTAIFFLGLFVLLWKLR